MLEKEFENWCKKTLQQGVNPIQIRDLRIAYYSGAGALWRNLVHPMIGRSVAGTDLVQLVNQLKDELNIFDYKMREGKI